MFFKYKALKGNQMIERQIEASSSSLVIDYLQKNGYFPISVTEVKQQQTSLFSFINNAITFNDVVDFTRQIAIMINAGLTLIDALEILKKQMVKPGLRKLIEDIDETIKAGGSFSSALKKFPGSFGGLYIALVKSGEASGKLGEILLRLADNLEKEREFKSKLKGALIYPALILVGMVVVMFIMITFVIPKLLNLYNDFNIELPFTTKILIFVSNFSVKFWPLIIIGTFALSYFARKYFQTKSGKYNLDKFLLKLPVMGKVISISALVDSTRTLSILIGSGVSILDALSIVIETTENLIFQKAFASVNKKVEKGQSLGVSLDQEGIFPPILVQMCLVGEQTGNLDDTLLRLSKYFEMESEISIKAMTSLIEPLILVILGFGVGFLVLSVITPIYNLTSSFQ